MRITLFALIYLIIMWPISIKNLSLRRGRGGDKVLNRKLGKRPSKNILRILMTIQKCMTQNLSKLLYPALHSKHCFQGPDYRLPDIHVGVQNPCLASWHQAISWWAGAHATPPVGGAIAPCAPTWSVLLCILVRLLTRVPNGNQVRHHRYAQHEVIQYAQHEVIQKM